MLQEGVSDYRVRGAHSFVSQEEGKSGVRLMKILILSDFSLWMKRCSKYKVDVTKPKQYQFFDLPFWDTVEQVEENLMTKRSACQKRQGAGVTAVAKK